MGHHHEHSHDHSHGHHHEAPATFTLAFALAIGLNLGFTILEAVYAILAHSMSLLADAGHNLGDVVGLLLSWGAMWLLAKKATDKYSYGFKRTTILAAMANSMLLMIAVVIIFYESVHKLIEPSTVNEKIVIIVALVGIAVNGGTALLFMKGQDDLNIKAAFLHLAYDALVSFGVVLTGVIIYFTQWHVLDPIVGLLIAVVILLGTWRILRQSIDLILDAVPANIDRTAVQEYLTNIPNVSAVHDLHIWGLSTKEAALTAHLVVPNNTVNNQLLSEIHHTLEHQFSIKHSTIQMEVEMDEECVRGECC